MQAGGMKQKQGIGTGIQELVRAFGKGRGKSVLTAGRAMPKAGGLRHRDKNKAIHPSLIQRGTHLGEAHY